MSRTLLAVAIWAVFGLVCLISEYAHAGDPPDVGSGKAIPTEEITRKPLRHSHFLVDLASKEITRSDTVKPTPPGLQRVMAEGAGRVANMTCADVRAVVAVYGAWKAEAVARAAGATEHQIREAKRCLK